MKDMVNIKNMILSDKFTNNVYAIRFKYYGDFDTIKLIHKDCKNELLYIGNSIIDAAPIFIYNINNISNVDKSLLQDFIKMNVYLRNLRLRKILEDNLNDSEKSILTFLNFFMYNVENNYIKGSSSFEINHTSTSS